MVAHSAINHAGILGGFPAAYSTYVPALTASTSNPTLGSGSVALGRYIQVGKMVQGTAIIAFGTSGAAAGSGSYRVSLPVTARTPDGPSYLYGQGRVTDDSGATSRGVLLTYVSTTTAALFMVDGSSGVTNASPWTWAISDYIMYSFVYEAA